MEDSLEARSKTVASTPSEHSLPSQTTSQRLWSEIRGYAEALLVAFLIVTFVFNTVGVVGNSMAPSLNGGLNPNLFRSILSGDRVFIPKYDTWLRRIGVLGSYQRGDVVVVREPENSPTAQLSKRRPFFIKRIIALPGDRIRIVEGQVLVNDHAINQSFITSSGEINPDPIDFPVVFQEDGAITAIMLEFLETEEGFDYPDLPYHNAYRNPTSVQDPRVQLHYGSTLEALEPIPQDAAENEPFILNIVVPEKHYFVMGDNREAAKGGRIWGYVPEENLVGKAVRIWMHWDWRSGGSGLDLSRIGRKISQ